MRRFLFGFNVAPDIHQEEPTAYIEGTSYCYGTVAIRYYKGKTGHDPFSRPTGNCHPSVHSGRAGQNYSGKCNKEPLGTQTAMMYEELAISPRYG